jgi:hypothetical protein
MLQSSLGSHMVRWNAISLPMRHRGDLCTILKRGLAYPNGIHKAMTF